LLTKDGQVARNDGIRGALSLTNKYGGLHENAVFVSSDDVDPDGGLRPADAGVATTD
jgi:hypothetical protein